MSNLQPNCCGKVDFQKVDKHTGVKWLIHDTKHRKEYQLQSHNPVTQFGLHRSMFDWALTSITNTLRPCVVTESLPLECNNLFMLHNPHSGGWGMELAPTEYIGVSNRMHYSDATMSAMTSQISSVSIVCSTSCLGAYQRKHQISLHLYHRHYRVNSQQSHCYWSLGYPSFICFDIFCYWT